MGLSAIFCLIFVDLFVIILGSQNRVVRSQDLRVLPLDYWDSGFRTVSMFGGARPC